MISSLSKKLQPSQIPQILEGTTQSKCKKPIKLQKNKIKVIWKPLINKTPSDPLTILTTMCNTEVISHQAGPQVAVFTCNQQLFRVIIDIMWDDPARWKYFYPHINGMHWLMNFVGSVGKLMKNSRLNMLIKTAFAGVDKMLISKNYP